MSTTFPKFTVEDGSEVFINPLSVCYFRSLFEGHNENKTKIVFDAEHSIVVHSSLENDQKLLTF
jgi:hypothetical protein